eukprot:CAMPEP_0114613734 /NCGR_PEP_ID=MMETSP0168-20121206/5287_1 /TAXON_ID=95228 ORGANISM="Vannella sp., Strain DIVA3 517/6/12" /NCGR_SAMPLE_ID=MMETSP0168 /ASSEMBLY_ACC=CAM_ASM_000044 /LENGTH=260 /DNA_ID=CAMNT_0001824753 /DNA_START=199 /DNA_END=978 /DNA_ORIENTATION=-
MGKKGKGKKKRGEPLPPPPDDFDDDFIPASVREEMEREEAEAAAAAAAAAAGDGDTADKEKDSGAASNAAQEGAKERKKKSKAQLRREKREREEAAREAEIRKARENGPNHRLDEILAIQAKLTPLGRTIHQVAADGNCLYSAVSDQLERVLQKKLSVKELRKLCADRIRQHSDDYQPFMDPSEPLEEYCKCVETTTEWGGDLEIRALAEALDASIVVHSASAPALAFGTSDHLPQLNVTYHKSYYALGAHYNSAAELPP